MAESGERMLGREEGQQQQQQRKVEERNQEEGRGTEKLEGLLPLQSSPYVKYTDLEDYKHHAYGAEGHVEPVVTDRDGGATDAPTISGSNITFGRPNTA